VNRRGEFNVPIGSKVNALRSDDNFSGVARLLNRAKLIHGDFERAVYLAEPGDLIYVDPPYTVRHNTNGFVKYNEKIFTFEDQIRLRRVLDVAVSTGADVIVSNADHDSIRDLYADFGLICSVNRASSISGNGLARGPTSEILVCSKGMGRRLAAIK
jgi:DNA adenine methylase